MGFEDLEFEDALDEEEGALPEEASNRTFIILAGVLGAVALLSLVCIAVYALVLLPRSRSAQEEQQATLDAQNTEVAAIIEQTSTSAAMDAIRAAYTSTPTETPIPSTPTPTATTPVVAVSPTMLGTTGFGTPSLDPLMATATYMRATLDAQFAQSTLTARPTTTAIGPYGFADEVGLPAMLGLAALLIVVIFLARRLRTA